MRRRLPLSMADLLASAVATQKRSSFEFCPGTAERMETLAAAADSGLAEHRVHDLLCDRVFSLAGFVMHCAWVEHTIAHVVALPYVVPDPPGDDDLDEARLRDLGRQGESKTAAAR